VTKTDQLFTFELDMGVGEDRLTGQALEDLIFNCLDFCLLNRKRAHFFLTGKDAERHPALWELLETLREEGASFSILSEPEQSEFQAHRSRAAGTNTEKLSIRTNGDVYWGAAFLGSAREDRLADLWYCARSGGTA